MIFAKKIELKRHIDKTLAGGLHSPSQKKIQILKQMLDVDMYTYIYEYINI